MSEESWKDGAILCCLVISRVGFWGGWTVVGWMV